MFLLDTNVISELSKPKPSSAVISWFTEQSGLCLSVLSIQEMVYGIELAPVEKRKYLKLWLAEVLSEKSLTIVTFDLECAKIAGRLAAKNQSSGRLVSILDVQIGASALRFNLSLATRNQKDFSSMGVSMVNPFDFLSS